MEDIDAKRVEAIYEQTRAEFPRLLRARAKQVLSGETMTRSRSSCF